jgi:hypothetical protein
MAQRGRKKTVAVRVEKIIRRVSIAALPDAGCEPVQPEKDRLFS